MSLINSIFKAGGKTKSSDAPIGEQLTLETLNQLIPIRNLSDDILESYALEHQSEIYPKDETLFNINEDSDSVIYLLKGTVTLSDSKDQSYEIEATEAKAKFPLSSGLKHTTTAIAKTKVSLLRVSQKIMSVQFDRRKKTELTIPDELKDSRLLQAFTQHLHDDELEIPSLPNIAIELRKAMQEEIGIHEAVKIIQLDPIISAKLIEVANCPLYLAAVPAKSCFEAVNRIGLNATRNLVISLSIKNIFKSNSVKIKKYLNSLWKNSLYLSNLCFVLASVNKQSNPEEALLAGLISDIGIVPFLNFTANLPSDYYTNDELKLAIPIVKGVVGAHILRKWGFTEEFIQVPLMSEDWYQNSGDSMTYTDIVLLSRLHTKIGRKGHSDLPAITSIPAASKLKNMTLSPENTLGILHDAKDKINDAMKIFSS